MNSSPNRQSIRYPGYDYSRPGAYFVTICAANKKCLFGNVAQDKIILNESGRIILACWQDISVHFPATKLDEFIIMPNHFHGIVWIVVAGSPRPLIPTSPHPNGNIATPSGETPEGGVTPPLRNSLGSVMGYFKYQSTKHLNALSGTPGAKVWQRNYFERIIRDEDELMDTRNYIRLNPHQWREDEYFTAEPDDSAHS